MQISIADSFLESLIRLSPGDGKRAAAFLDKMVHAPDAAGLRPEIVHDADDRAIRSFKVTHDLRAIAHVEADRVVLLFVGRHDVAYDWARGRCVECHPVTGELQLVANPSDASVRLAAAGVVEAAARIASAGADGGGLFDDCTDEYLLSIGVPPSWLPTIRMVRSEEMLLSIAFELPADVADRLMRVATGELVTPQPAEARRGQRDLGPFEAAETQWLCTVTDGKSLCRVLDEAGIDHGLAI